MNFLEKLVAEWYEYKGYFVMCNIPVEDDNRRQGGIIGEIDVLAFHPTGLNGEGAEIIHIETSSDSYTWEKRVKIFKKKFSEKERVYYEKLKLPKNCKIKRMVYLFCSNKPKDDNKEYFEKETKAQLKTVHQFLEEIVEHFLENEKTGKKLTVPEKFPLLRAIQLAIRHGNLKN